MATVSFDAAKPFHALDGQDMRDRPFEPWRRPASARANELVKWAISIFEQRGASTAPRQRRRSTQPQHIMEETVSALICDATHRELTKPGGRMMLSLSNEKLGMKSRYRPLVFSRSLPAIIGVLEGPFLNISKGSQNPFGKARQTTVALSDHFKGIVRGAGVGLEDFQCLRGGEVVFLKKSREGFWEGGELLEYDDTPATMNHRERVRRVNARLAVLDLEFDGTHPRAPRVDVGDRALRRIFNNGRFDHGGRLFGGFWQELKKRERFDALRLDGDEAAILDFRQMAPRLLYARTEVTPPRDCYEVPNFEEYRTGWKKLLNALLFVGPTLSRLPKNTADLLPKRIGVVRAVELLLKHNAPIAPLIEKDVGFELMFLESEVLVDVLLEMESHEVGALPIHDAIIVPEHAGILGAEVMAEVFHRRTGQRGAVSLERRPLP